MRGRSALAGRGRHRPEAAVRPAAEDNYLVSNKYTSWDVTELVRAWQAGEENYGWDFYTSEYLSSSDPDYIEKRPRLTVFYE